MFSVASSELTRNKTAYVFIGYSFNTLWLIGDFDFMKSSLYSVRFLVFSVEIK